MSLEFWTFDTFIGSAVGYPSSVLLADGNTLVVYSRNGTNGAAYAIIDQFGEQVGSGEINPNAGDAQYVYSMLANDDGGFTLLYGQNGQSSTGLYIQHFNASLQATSQPILIDNDIGGSNRPAQFVELPGGGYAIVYSSFNGNDLYDLEFRILDAAGNVGEVLPVVTTIEGQQYEPRIASNGDNLLVSWWDAGTSSVRGQMLALDGSPIGDEFLVNSSVSGQHGRPQVGVFSNGNYIVVWEADGAPGADNDSGSARARLFAPDGTPLGNEFVLNDDTAGFQGAPNVTVLPDDSFVISYFGPGGGFRWFESDGTPRTDTLESGMPLAQTSLVALGDGRMIAFGVDSGLTYAIIDGRMGEFNGDEGDNILLAPRDGPSTIFGFGGNDTFYGNDFADTFYGGEGNDVFRTRLGLDTLYGGPGDDHYYFTPFSNSSGNITTVIEEADEGFDTIYTHGFMTLPDNVEAGILYADAGTSSLNGNELGNMLVGNDSDNELSGFAGVDIFFPALGDDVIDGGSNVDTVAFSGNASQYTITQTSTGVFRVRGPDGTDVLTNIEFAQFDDQTLRLLPGTGVTVNFDTADPSVYQSALEGLRDFDGNDLGGDGFWLRIGSADVNGDGDVDQILVNDAIGRFATVGTADDGLVYFEDHGWAGETRVAGIYIDPLVQSGDVVQGSDNDSQRRFQNDLEIENINRVLGADDYDGDGIWEVYFALTDGTAYLRALMHEDGNIRYANYQSEQEVIDYLTANGYDESTFGDWFPSGSESASETLTFVNRTDKAGPADGFEMMPSLAAQFTDELASEFYG